MTQAERRFYMHKHHRQGVIPASKDMKRYDLMYRDEKKLISQNYALCIYKMNTLLQSGGYEESLFKIILKTN